MRQKINYAPEARMETCTTQLDIFINFHYFSKLPGEELKLITPMYVE
jgi:hypothetical protein